MVGGVAGGALGAQLGGWGAAVGATLGSIGAWIGVRAAFAQARDERERNVLVRGAWEIGLLAIGFSGAMCLCTFNFHALQRVHPWLGIGGLVMLGTGYAIVLPVLIRRLNARFQRVRAREA